MIARLSLFLGLLVCVPAASAADQDCDHPMTIKVKGSISQEDVLAKVKPAIPDIQSCYDRLLENSKTAAGRVTITSYLRKNGKVEKVEVCASEKLMNKRLKMCIKRRMRRITYPAGITPSEIQFPMDLSPQ